MTAHELQLLAAGVYLGLLLAGLVHIGGEMAHDRRQRHADLDPDTPIPYTLTDQERP